MRPILAYQWPFIGGLVLLSLLLGLSYLPLQFLNKKTGQVPVLVPLSMEVARISTAMLAIHALLNALGALCGRQIQAIRLSFITNR